MLKARQYLRKLREKNLITLDSSQLALPPPQLQALSSFGLLACFRSLSHPVAVALYRVWVRSVAGFDRLVLLDLPCQLNFVSEYSHGKRGV